MASHAGQLYTIKTKKGYIGPDNTYVDKIEDCVVTGYTLLLGIGRVLEALGYDEREGEVIGIESSYEFRLGNIEQELLKMGYSQSNMAYMYEAERLFNLHNCYDNSNYLKLMSELNEKIMSINANVEDQMVRTRE